MADKNHIKAITALSSMIMDVFISCSLDKEGKRPTLATFRPDESAYICVMSAIVAACSAVQLYGEEDESNVMPAVNFGLELKAVVDKYFEITESPPDHYKWN